MVPYCAQPQNQLEDFLTERNKILSFPRLRTLLDPGRIYRGIENNYGTMELNGIGNIGDILVDKKGQPVNFRVKRELKKENYLTVRFLVPYQSSSNLDLNISFFEGLFSLIKSGLGITVSAKYSRKNIYHLFHLSRSFR